MNAALRLPLQSTALESEIHLSSPDVESQVSNPSWSGGQQPTTLFGLTLENSDLATVAKSLVARAGQQQPCIVQFVNAHCINTLLLHPGYRQALARADAILPDGSGIALAAKLAGVTIQSNLNGTDLFPHLCTAAAQEGQALFLLGGAPGVAATVGHNMRKSHPWLDIAGAANGFFDAHGEQALIDRINQSGASILLVGLGVPLQEIWIARNRHRITVPVLIGVGGLFDYYSNRIPRAPAVIRRMGMEWIWRLAQEPRRLAKRYLIGNMIFMGHAITHGWLARCMTSRYANALKRALDITIVISALILLSPLFAAIALLITLDDRGPVFFRQTRIGAGGKPFRMWKFRSMAVDAEARRQKLLAQSERDGTCFKMKNDPRITGVGRWLRRLSLDELPQIFNVLRGEMSIVGPRPALPQEVITYDDRARNRLNGAPGLTCTWQVSGRANIPFEQQVELDITYLEQRSLLGDVKLIAQTVPAVVTGKGAY